jgi:hypothetical protein
MAARMVFGISVIVDTLSATVANLQQQWPGRQIGFGF